MEPNIPAQPIQPVPPEINDPVAQSIIPTIPVQPIKPKPKFLKWIIVIIIFICLIMAGGISAYVLNKHSIAKTPVDQKTAVNPVSNWKTFNDTDFKFSFAYPSNLSVQKIQHDPIGAEISVYDPKIGTESGTILGINIYYEVFGSYLPEYINFDNLYSSPSGSIINMHSQVFGNYQMIKNANTILNNKKAFYYTRTPLPIDTKEPGTGKGLYVKPNQDLVIIIESPENKFENLNQILSTFKFTN